MSFHIATLQIPIIMVLLNHWFFLASDAAVSGNTRHGYFPPRLLALKVTDFGKSWYTLLLNFLL